MAKDRDKKWTACLELMQAVRALIARTDQRSCSDTSETLVDFDMLCSISRDAQGANVFLARDKNSAKLVVVKQYLHSVDSWDLPPSVIRQLHSSVCFLEAQLDSRNKELRHNAQSWIVKKCIQKILDLQISEHMTFVVFKYYPVMLNTVFQDKQHHDPNFVLTTINDLILSVATMHSAGVTHRDIKLENLCFSKRTRVVLIDFDSGAQTLDNMLRRTLPVCSIHTRPPEHYVDSVREQKTDLYDPIAGDWWSVGCVIAQLFLSGQHLFVVRRDWQEHEYLSEIRKFCSEFALCFANESSNSNNARVKTLLRSRMPSELRTFLVGVLSLDGERRKHAAQTYITTLLSKPDSQDIF